MAKHRPIKVLLADDHFLVRQGLRTSLSEYPQIEIVGEASNGREAVDKAQRLAPDVVLMDINMPDMNGLEATAALRKRGSGARVLALTVHNNKQYILQIIRSGAQGYVLKDTSPDELVRGIQAVQNGEAFFSPSVSGVVLQLLRDENRASDRNSESVPLTPREAQIVKLVATGKTNKEIASELNVNVRTVETQRYQLMRRINVRNAAELTRFAIERGLAPA
ncbi:MAG TPA: response regulator transcription factor [Candidatus Binatia bacterium]|nr:response regulator transcription factor [Candidatus Binatia bacterium]